MGYGREVDLNEVKDGVKVRNVELSGEAYFEVVKNELHPSGRTLCSTTDELKFEIKELTIN